MDRSGLNRQELRGADAAKISILRAKAKGVKLPCAAARWREDQYDRLESWPEPLCGWRASTPLPSKRMTDETHG
jgi:hypothetical protein